MKQHIPQERFWIFPKVHRPVFIVSAALIVGFILFGALFSDLANTVFVGIQNFFASYLGWAMILLVNALLIFVIFMAFGPFGDVRLGKMEEDPEYSLFSWTAMLFPPSESSRARAALARYPASMPMVETPATSTWS